jgi:hypothetical protein
MITIEELKQAYEKQGGEWELFNIFGIRTEEEQEEDIFNDFIGVATDSVILIFPGTTDPGWKATEEHEGGAAHLCLGFHQDIWMIGIHAKSTPFAHEAFRQIGNKVKIWRDANRDGTYEGGEPIQTGYFGINLHRASIHGSELIGPYGEGCQVLKNPDDLKTILDMAKVSGLRKFSYMLFDRSQITI